MATTSTYLDCHVIQPLKNYNEYEAMEQMIPVHIDQFYGDMDKTKRWTLALFEFVRPYLQNITTIPEETIYNEVLAELEIKE